MVQYGLPNKGKKKKKLATYSKFFLAFEGVNSFSMYRTSQDQSSQETHNLLTFFFAFEAVNSFSTY